MLFAAIYVAVQATESQVNSLKSLGADNNCIKGLTKATASDKITELLQARDAAGPSPKQLKLLEVRCDVVIILFHSAIACCVAKVYNQRRSQGSWLVLVLACWVIPC
jgi:hypothetical protein